jgi:hypothetical protein
MKAFLGKVWAFIKLACLQAWSVVSDAKWDADTQKIAGLGMVALGSWLMVTCILKWDFASTAPQYAIALITLGCGLLGWRGHTDI